MSGRVDIVQEFGCIRTADLELAIVTLIAHRDPLTNARIFRSQVGHHGRHGHAVDRGGFVG